MKRLIQSDVPSNFETRGIILYKVLNLNVEELNCLSISIQTIPISFNVI